MIIDNKILSVSLKPQNRLFDLETLNNEARNVKKPVKTFKIITSHKKGITVKNKAKQIEIPREVFKYSRPAITVRKLSPTALPTIGIKFDVANFTERIEILSAFALIKVWAEKIVKVSVITNDIIIIEYFFRDETTFISEI